MNQLPDIYVCGEIYIDIEHYLLGSHSRNPSDQVPTPGYATPTVEKPNPTAPRSHPISDVSDIKHLYSHPQAFGQCSTFISTYLKNAELHDVSSTSKGAEIVSQNKDSKARIAAIASESAANIFNLEVLAKCIQDKDDNTTRFFIIRKSTSIPHVDNLIHRRYPIKDDIQLRSWKTLVGFGIDHLKPGALADALNAFKTYGLNLTSINSRPSQRRPWHYIFFVEFEGKVDSDGKGKADQALKSLEQYTEEFRWFGSWQNRNNRT
jgi:prephenate dehydratase